MLTKLPTSLPQSVSGNLQKTTRTLEQEKAGLKKATKEFEAFFKYYMLKTMRQTIPDDPLTKDLPLGDTNGKDTFTDMFDMEVAKAGSGGKRSLSEIMYNSMEKLVEARFRGKEAKAAQATAHSRQAISLQSERTKMNISAKAKPIQIIRKPQPSTLPAREKEKATSLSHDRVLQAFQRHIDDAAAETKLDSTLIASVIHAESGGNPNAVSKAGAKGLMQLIDSTAQQYGATNTFDPEENIKAGSRFLKDMLNRYKDVKLALAAYNAGPGNVDRYGGIPPFKETQDYVAKVTALMEKADSKAEVVATKVP